ncbi:MAG TPA: cytochrome c, partial [Myxococcota bacterium]|nr:cytochrome c [Myxococcota bacterium]
MPTTTPSALLPEDRSPAEDDLHRLVALLDYLASDYAGAVAPGGRILDAGEYAEQQQLAAKLLPLLQAVPPGRAPAATVAAIDADLRAATALLDAKADPTVLRARLTSVRRAVVDGFGLVLSPSSPPSRENGAALYTRACAECHGAEGYPPADKVKALDPPPRTLRDRAVTDGLSPYRVFNAVTYGVEGTAMPDFSALPAHDRWDLAFYVLALAHTPPRGAPASPASGVAPAPLPSSVRTTLAALAATTDGELRDALAPAGEPAAEAALAALRTDVPYRPDAGRAPIAVTRRLLDEALARAAAGDRAGASDLLVDAYLEGFERAEPLLRPRHGALVADIEAGFLALRTAVRNGEPP